MVRNGHINKKTDDPEGRRTHIVIATNKKNLALVRLTSNDGKKNKYNYTRLKNYQNNNCYFKHFVEIKDVNNNPLYICKDVTANHKNMDLSVDNVKYIYSTILNSKQKDLFIKNMNEFNKKN